MDNESNEYKAEFGPAVLVKEVSVEPYGFEIQKNRKPFEDFTFRVEGVSRYEFATLNELYAANEFLMETGDTRAIEQNNAVIALIEQYRGM